MVKVGRGQTDKWNDTKRERKLGQGLVSWGRDTEEQKRGRRDREIVAHGKWDEFQPNTGWLRHACCRTDQSTTQFREVIFCLSLSLSVSCAHHLFSLDHDSYSPFTLPFCVHSLESRTYVNVSIELVELLCQFLIPIDK